MKLDRFPSKKLLVVAVAALLPMGSAQALTVYDSLKTLLQPGSVDEARLIRDSPSTSFQHYQSNMSDRRSRGAQGPQGAEGPYRTDQGQGVDVITTDQPVIIMPADPTDSPQYQSPYNQ